MSDATTRTGLAGLPPSNRLAANKYNPTAGVTGDTPDGFPPGTPVVQSLTLDRTVIPGKANHVETSSLVGLTAEPAAPGNPVLTQFDGVLTLTTEQWDQITGEAGGLLINTRYYLGFAFFEGRLIRIPPTAPGTFVVSVGVALSPTDFLIQLCVPEPN